MVAYSFKRRFVEPIRAGLSSVSLSFDPHPKRQTIRAIGKRRHARPGETLQLYHGMRSKQCFKIGDALCTSIEGITIKVPKDDAWLSIKLDCGAMFEAGDSFAIADGFKDIDDMWQFLRSEHPGVSTFHGVLIKMGAASMTRTRPANRRAHETIAIDHDGQRYKIGIGRDVASVGNVIDVATRRRSGELGPIVEVFLNAQQVNSQVDVLASDGAILMSLLLQHGCDPETIFHAMKRNPDGSLASPLGRAAAYLVEEQS